MDDFKKRPIKSGPTPSDRQKAERSVPVPLFPPAPSPPLSPTRYRLQTFLQHHYVWSAIILVIFVAMGKATWNIATLANELSIKEVFLSVFSEKVLMDEEKHTNILLLGTGNPEHDGAHLTDTIIVASIDHRDEVVSMLSIPRDFYLKIPELYGGNRINSIVELVSEQEQYQNKVEEEAAYLIGYDVLQQAVSNLLGIDIHYYAQVDFDAFVEIVDALGGINVNVENAIYDPFYPAEDGTIGYKTFAIDAGPQKLDGDTALQYVRSRKTTSDFDRAIRQQQVLEALKEKALSLGVLTNPNRLKNIYGALRSNTHTNLQWAEMVYLAKMAADFDRANLLTWVINDNPLTEGGLLYTPERELYQGAFVLVPFLSDNSDLQRFARVVLYEGEGFVEPLTYQILNGTKQNGVATETMYYLGRFGFDIVRFGNGPDVTRQTTRIIPRTPLLQGQTGKNATLHPQLQTLREQLIPVGEIVTELPLEYSPAAWESQADVIIELGQDYVDWMNANQRYFY